MKTNRAALIGLMAGAALALAAPAANADGMARGGVKSADCCGYNWGGVYVGLSAGWQQTGIDATGAADPTQLANVDQDSWIVGGIIGIQRQWGNVVLGLEANWSSAMQDEKWGSSLSPSASCLAGLGGQTCQGRMQDLFTIGPRVGWAANNWLFFATGGYAQGSIATQTFATVNPGVVVSRTKDSHDGWFIGGGVEWAVSKSVILGLEYQHVSLGGELHKAFDGAQVAVPGYDRNVDADSDIVRARVTFKLDRDCCTSAPMK